MITHCCESGLISNSLIEHYLSRTILTENGCMLWQGSVNSTGYPRFRIHTNVHFGHRVIYIAQRGLVPRDIKICHSCDIPSCINIDHLFSGTQADNMLDMAKKQRHPSMKITPDKVIEIRKLYDSEDYHTGKLIAIDIAKLHGISEATVYNIGKRETWKWLA